MTEHTRDARSLSRETQAELRRIAVRLAETRLLSHATIADVLGVHKDTIGHWVSKARQLGDAAFEASPAVGGSRATYSLEQENWILEQLRAHPDPRDFGYARAGWTLALIKHWLEHTPEIGFAPDASTIGKMLRRRGLRYRAALTRSDKAKEEDERTFLERIWSEVQQQAQEENAIMVFLDECGVRQEQVDLHTWMPRGERPRLTVNTTRAQVNVIGAIETSGELWYEVFSGRMDAPRFLAFLKRLKARWPDQPLIVVTDRHPCHTARLVEAYIEQNSGLELVFLPAYTPWLNPQESVWQLLKHIVHRQYPVQKQERLHNVVDFEMREIQQDKRRLRNLFQHPDLLPLGLAPHARATQCRGGRSRPAPTAA